MSGRFVRSWYNVDMTKKPPVIAAIPNYNMANSLKPLLEQMVNQPDPYDYIYVLDDASTDDSRAVAKSFGRDVRLIAGQENLGSGGNRNRILETLCHTGHTALIHFVDADVSLDVDDWGRAANPVPQIAADLLEDRHRTAFVGGLVRTEEGKQMSLNYGPLFSLHTHATGLLQVLSHDNPKRHRRLQHFLEEYPNPNAQPTARAVHWASEANLLINSSVLARLGGFDQKLRGHDIQPLSLQAKRQGLVGRFDPSFAVTHHPQGNKPPLRDLKRHLVGINVVRHHSTWRDFIFPDGSLRPQPPTA